MRLNVENANLFAPDIGICSVLCFKLFSLGRLARSLINDFSLHT